jgi:Outer membrane protein beta-barrel domain
MRLFFKFIFLLTIYNSFGQDIKDTSPMNKIDSLYREDQFYCGLSFNLMQNKPQGYQSSKISPSFTAGFLRDMPVNKNRTKAIALGLGLTYNKFAHDLVVFENEGKIEYTTPELGKAFDKNKLEQITLDLPIELRWRTSEPQSHEFFRIYTGVKLSYLIFSKSKYVDADKTIVIFGNDDLTKLRTNAYLAFGYNTWNGFVSYGFSPIFKSSAKLNGQEIGLNNLNIGVMFYIL